MPDTPNTPANPPTPPTPPKQVGPPRREPDFDFLDPAKVRLTRSEDGRVRLTVEGERSYLDAKIVRAFPFSQSGQYVSFLDAKDRDMAIGTVVHPEELDSESRAILDNSLGMHYFLPTITKVHSLKEEFGTMYFDVETDRGPRKFVARGIRDGMEEMETGEILIPDVDGNRYRLADLSRMDHRSRRLLDKFI